LDARRRKSKEAQTMDEIARFRCPHCLQMTTFRPAVHEALFGPQRIAPSYTSYEVSCKHCRRQFTFAFRGPSVLTTAEMKGNEA
jgi:hypothetical protein